MPKVYRGIRTTDGVRVTVYGHDGAASPLQHHRQHSPDGFEWGYAGSGPADLALALCIDVLGSVPATAVYQAVKNDLIAGIASDSWELSDAAVLDSIARARHVSGHVDGREPVQ